jgi:hypothetical protein
VALLFLSHSSSDAALASELCERLEARGVDCFVAPRDLTLGRPYPEECVRGIEASDALVLLATPAAVSSVQVVSEVEQAHKRKKPIYTVMIGQPNVSRELDFYISRLHWFRKEPGSIEPLAAALAAAVAGERDWTDLAIPPSLARRLRHRRDLFVVAASTALVFLAAIVAGAAFLFARARDVLNHDYRSLGFVSVAVHEATGGDPSRLTAELQVWLTAADVRFADVALLTTTVGRDGALLSANHSSSLQASQTERMRFVTVALPRDARQFTSCLVVPSAALGGKYRVTQQFAVSAGSANVDAPSASPMSEARVAPEDGRPCGAP